MRGKDSISPVKTYFTFNWPKLAPGSSGKEFHLQSDLSMRSGSQANQPLPHSAIKAFSFTIASPSQTKSASKRHSKRERFTKIPDPPAKPLSWIWQCHICRNNYPLHVTRRCLNDGHYYCSGDANADAQRSVKRKKRGQSCISEFDYAGWATWDSWKRKNLALTAYANGKAAPVLKGCENCDFPSQCRYERRAFTQVLLPENYLDSLDKPDENEKDALRRIKPETAECSNMVDQKDVRRGRKRGNVRTEQGLRTSNLHENSSEETIESNLDEKLRFYSNASNVLSSTNLVGPLHHSDSHLPAKPPQPSKPTAVAADSKLAENNITAVLSREQTQVKAEGKEQEHDSTASSKGKSFVKLSTALPLSAPIKKSFYRQSLLTDFFQQNRLTHSPTHSFPTPSPAAFFPSLSSTRSKLRDQANHSRSSAAISDTEKQLRTYQSTSTDPCVPNSSPLLLETAESKEAELHNSHRLKVIADSVCLPVDDFQFDFDIDEASHTEVPVVLGEHPEPSARLEHEQSVTRPTGTGSGPCTISRWKKRRQHTHHASDWEDVSLDEPG